MKNVLVVSYFFPPFSGGGIIRIHNFVKYFPLFDIRPVVLTIDDAYYPSMYFDDQLQTSYDSSVDIIRTSSIEPAGKELRDKVYGTKERTSIDKIVIGIVKRIVNLFLIPDRYVLWTPSAVRAGKQAVRKNQIDAVLATAPPFTSHLVAYIVAKSAKLPLILDTRDDWIGNVYYETGNYFRRRIERFMESRIVRYASHVVCATPESVELYRKKYPALDPTKFSHISNGFDPELFADATPKQARDTICFVHTGSLPPKRSPEFFVRAVRRVIDSDPELANIIRVRFVGYAPLEHENLVKELGLEAQISFVPNMPQEDVANMLSEEADVCLIFQRNVDGGQTAIPGKIYEYIAVRKPILCMTDGGSTANLLKRLGANLITEYDDVDSIAESIENIVRNYGEFAASFDWADETVDQFSRKEQTRALAERIEELVEPAAPGGM